MRPNALAGTGATDASPSHLMAPTATLDDESFRGFACNTLKGSLFTAHIRHHGGTAPTLGEKERQERVDASMTLLERVVFKLVVEKQAVAALKVKGITPIPGKYLDLRDVPSSVLDPCITVYNSHIRHLAQVIRDPRSAELCGLAVDGKIAPPQLIRSLFVRSRNYRDAANAAIRAKDPKSGFSVAKTPFRTTTEKLSKFVGEQHRLALKRKPLPAIDGIAISATHEQEELEPTPSAGAEANAASVPALHEGAELAKFTGLGWDPTSAGTLIPGLDQVDEDPSAEQEDLFAVLGIDATSWDFDGLAASKDIFFPFVEAGDRCASPFDTLSPFRTGGDQVRLPISLKNIDTSSGSDQTLPVDSAME
jgi:hypothetical protein